MSRLILLISLAVGLLGSFCFASPSRTHAVAARTHKRADCTPTLTGLGESSSAEWILGKKPTGQQVRVSLSADKQVLQVRYPPYKDYQYQTVSVWLGTSRPTDTNPGGYPWGSNKGSPRCTVSGATASCDIPLSEALPNVNLCPAKTIYIVTHASVKSPTLGAEGGTAGGLTQCIKTSCNPWFTFWSFTTKCGCDNPPPPPPPPPPPGDGQWCDFGSAFGHSASPPGVALECNPPWGWSNQIDSAPLGGTLWVGGLPNYNDINVNAVNVGPFTAFFGDGQVHFRYVVDVDYRLTAVHAHVACSPSLTTCSLDQYAIKIDGLAVQEYETPSVSVDCNKPYIIVHARIQKKKTETTCPSPWNTGAH
ncbi:uncharacterized protein BO72DRAFT_443954 [Aspergillus fijiensis CBS 313.89]|uniref:Uncharacterized protein n=1 Tax=Aspergillus fijiensis CBS 313.89 TaxID=1448319 RepID=A0A8G1W2Y5_9EURO|nr:uncharacterized protein BO72DRAFT_443954 [Aspergillus fijiensis CBS 313.89]RAK81917.1 hypothetical protein BO72DRAFT_443954 [Aspergillus fijiensis CBS 313.89]